MSVSYHERPGVYSDYDASSASSTTGGRSVAAVAGLCPEAESGVTLLTSYAAGAAKYGAESPLGQLLKSLYDNGAGVVLACPVKEDSVAAYTAVFEALLAEKRAAFLVCGSTEPEVHAALKSAVVAASEQRNECIGLCGLSDPTAEELLEAAETLNCERMVLCGPDVRRTADGELLGGGMLAAAVAGLLAGQTDPALPLNGASVQGLHAVSRRFDETALDVLIRGGVTVLETVGGVTEVIRGITSRSKTGGVPDTTWRELTTILIVDEVIPGLRNALRSRFGRCKNNRTTRAAIRAQVVLELESRLRREIIDSYDQLTVRASEEDPTVCLVEFGFTVTHGLSRIYLTAHITV